MIQTRILAIMSIDDSVCSAGKQSLQWPSARGGRAGISYRLPEVSFVQPETDRTEQDCYPDKENRL